MSLLLTYIGDDRNRKFDILVDGTLIATADWHGGDTGKFYDFLYTIPQALTRGKTVVNVKIEANHEVTAGRIFGCRTLRK